MKVNLKSKIKGLLLFIIGIPNNFLKKNKLVIKKDKKVVIGYIGRLENYKGVDILIKSFLNLCKKRNDLLLSITGDGKELNNLQEIVTRNDIENKVKFNGRQEDIIPILNDIDIFVYPSICNEGLGISIIEAMSQGCIPVGFNKGGIPELIRDNENGFIADDITEKSLSEAMEKAISIIKKGEDESIRKKNIEMAKEFSISNTINRLNSELKKILE